MKILIEDKLRALNKTNKWLSEITDIPYSTLNRLIKGEIKTLPMEEIDKICTALECEIGDIVISDSDETIKTKVENENKKLALKERLKLFKSLIILKNLSNSSELKCYDEIAAILENLFNKRFENRESSTLLNKSNKDVSLEDILSSYDDIDKLLINPTENSNKHSIWDSISPRSNKYDDYIDNLMSLYMKSYLNEILRNSEGSTIELSEYKNDFTEDSDIKDEVETKDIIV